MKMLLVHAEDDPEKGPWLTMPWDRIVDLGLGGVEGYERWTRRYGCPVTTLSSLRDGVGDFGHVRELLSVGCGRLLDTHGLDWWELMSLLLHNELEIAILLQHFAQTVGSAGEVHVSRPGLHASILQCLLPGRVKAFPLRREAKRSGIGHYVRVFNKLSAGQLIDVFWDKNDPGYQFRGRLVRRRSPSRRPVVLLPTAYVNVSRIGVAYANTFPGENFLLVATRRSGWIEDDPRNVAAQWLSSYASVRDRSDEGADIESRWRTLRNELESVTEFEILHRLGYLDSFPRWIRRGLEVRDAWLNVLETEPVQAVLCADDSNPYTRIPLLLAHERGMATIACHHGALDGRYLFKRNHSDVIWVKGRMEEDYLVRRCGVPKEKVEIAAPALLSTASELGGPNRSTFRPYLIFFSEACENAGGRTEEFYRDILPLLANLAQATGRELIVKLHPAESKHERSKALDRILSADQRRVTRIVSGPLLEDLLAKAWFGITILSTVAMECAVREIPCFLCKWLDFGSYGYVEQFIRFGAGIGLSHPSELQKIPEFLRQHSVSPDVAENCWQPAASGRLREFLASAQKPCTAVAR